MNKILMYVLIGLVVLFGGLYLQSESSKDTSFRGLVHNVQEIFTGGLKAGSSNQLSISSAGLLTTTGGLTLGSSGTAISKYACASGSWDPAAITSSTNSVATTSLTLTGATLGDTVTVSFASATSTEVWRITAKITASNTAQAMLTSMSNASLDLSTSTLKICYFN